MGFLGFGNFTKEGPGVRKDAPQKRGFFLFFELFFRKFGRMFRMNVLYSIAALPAFIITCILAGLITHNIISAAMTGTPEFMAQKEIIDLVLRIFLGLIFMVFWGMGPVTAGFHYVLRNYARDKHAWLLSDFREHTRKNFRQALVVWLIDLAAMVLFGIAFLFYSQQKGALFFLRYVVISILVFYTMMHYYIYQMMVTFKLSLKNIYKNAMIFAIAKLPLNFFITLVLLLINVGIPYYGLVGFGGATPILYWIVLICLYIFIFISLSGFVVSFNANRAIRELMLPEEEEPVDEDEIIMSEEERL